MAEKVINKNGKIKQISVDKLEEYLALGWDLGRGLPPWNKGLTKDTDDRVKKYATTQTGKKLSSETKQKIKEKLTGRKLSEEHIKNRTKAQKGLKRSASFKEKQRLNGLGRHLSEEAKLKISKANSGKPERPLLEEAKLKISIHNSSKEFQEYQRAKKIANGTINTSKPETESFILLENKFGKDNINKYYTDSRYPFECDAYIKDLDLFIEFNYHWTHGKHPYNSENEEDNKILNRWQQRAPKSKFYKIAINVWTKRDVEKYNCAKQNNLNYFVFYNINDFKNWIINYN